MRGVSAAVACLAAVPAVTGYIMGGFAGRQLAMPRRETVRQGGMTMRLFDHKRRAIKEREQLEGWAKAGEEGHVEPSETNLRPFPGNYKKHYRSGRGPGAGSPGSSGYGMRGQNSRGGVRPGFEGGQQPQYRRAPKWPGRPMGPGHEKTEYALIQLEDLNVAAELFPNRNVVDPKFLVNYYVLTKQKRKLFKVVGGDATVDRGLTVMAHAFTSSAAAAIEQAGGKCVLLSPTTNEVLPIEGVDVEAVMSQVKTEEAKTAEEEAAGVYFDHPRPGGARDRVRKSLREADREAFERLSSSA